MKKKLDLNFESQIANNPKFCVMPFTHQYVATDGFVNLCCLADYNQPIVKHVGGHDLQEVWTSDTMQEIRKNMLEEKYESRCEVCYKQDREGGGSDRESQNTVFINRRKQKRNPVFADIEKGNSTGYPFWSDLRPGRLCNFGCRMCFGAVSSTIAKEQKKYPETQGIMQEEWKDVDDWIEDPICFESVKKQVPNLHTIKIAGGEPLFMPGVYKLLKWCVESGNTHLILDITTNGSRLKSKVTPLLSKFKQVELHFSMDGIGYANDYIRYGADWQQLDIAYKHYLSMPQLHVHVLATAQIYNAWELGKLLDYWIENGVRGNFVFNPVNVPRDLILDIIPYEYRIEIAEDLEKRLPLLTDEQIRISRLRHILSRLTTSYDDLETIERHKGFIKNFVKRTLTYDKIRNQDVTKIHPKFTEIWKKWLKDYVD